MGGAMLLVVSFTTSSLGLPLPYSERVVVGSVFIAFCVLGIVSSLKLIHLGRQKPAARMPATREGHERRKRVGHHPDCDSFETHVIPIGTKKVCGGCLGLALGSSAAIVFMTYYLFGVMVAPAQGPWLVLFAVILVLIAFVESAMHSRLGKVHVLANALLVIGFFLMTIGVSSATGSGVAGLFTIMICLLYMDTRIRISEWNHANICQKCGRPCRSY